MSVLNCIPIFWTPSVVGYVFFILFVGSLVYKILR